MNMQDALDQAFAAGRAAEREMAKISATVRDSYTQAGRGAFLSQPTAERVTKAADAPKAPKATHIARGANKASGPRVKGVKEAIIALIAGGALSVGEIVKLTGFKATSVRATLMGLKKAQFAVSDEAHRWRGTAEPFNTISGNSDHATTTPA